MNDYELTLIVRPALADSERDKLVDKIKKMVESGKGEVKTTDLWGKKQMTYEIKKNREGYYIYLALSLGEKEVRELDRRIKLDEAVLRYLLVKSQISNLKSQNQMSKL